jgi:adenine-specific DNA-methyltransferase
MNKLQLIQKIKSISDLTHEEQAELINLVNNTKKYGLVWEDKFEQIEEDLLTNLPVLTEVKERFVEAKPMEKPKAEEDLFTDSDGEPAEAVEAPNHILIEGDNLHALAALSFTHRRSFDVIYIDPPYNTGKPKEFKYNDRYVDKEDSYRHSKWLSFMHKRLVIAKSLLKDDGAIMISIDDYELSQLKLLLDEVFGSINFAGQWHWFKSATPPNLAHKIKKNIEYILVYEKEKTSSKFRGVFKGSKSDDPLTKPQNTVKTLVFPKGTLNIKLKDGNYEPGVYGTEKFPNLLLNELKVKSQTNENEVAFENKFVWTQDKLNEEIEKSTKLNLSKSMVLSYKKMAYTAEAPPNLIDDSVGVGTTEEAGNQLIEMFGKEVFEYPKNIDLIKYLLNFKDLANGGKILDFFAGSGTTLHATMQLNAEDGGNRQCILVTNNENNICEEVTYERNKRVIQGYTNAKGVLVDGLTNNNLRYYKCDYVPSAKNEANRRKLTEASTDLLCIKEDCYNELTTEHGFNPKQCRLFSNNSGKYMVVIYHSRQQQQVNKRVIEFIENRGEITEKVRLYAFSPDAEVLLEEFYQVREKVKAVPLPDAIYNAYRTTFKSMGLGKRKAKEDEGPSSQEELANLFNQEETTTE